MSCYHRTGRTKKAWACGHDNKLHYSKGLCQNCYLANYYQERKAKNTLKTKKPKGDKASKSSADEVSPSSEEKKEVEQKHEDASPTSQVGVDVTS